MVAVNASHVIILTDHPLSGVATVVHVFASVGLYAGYVVIMDVKNINLQMKNFKKYVY